MSDDKKASGTFEAPPDHAPRETAQPLTAEAVSEMRRRAQANERSLAPLKPPGVPLPPAPAPPTPVSHQPAASDTDSPSRGRPRPVQDPGKAITGGFGAAMEAQYYPLDGTELREVVRACMDELNARLDTDLRFSVAVTYPRAHVAVVIEVTGYAEDAGFKIDKRSAPHDKTPIEVARAHGADEIAFVIRAVRREFDADGNPESPPDRLRDELGLPKPHKQMVGTGTGRSVVDVVPEGPEIL